MSFASLNPQKGESDMSFNTTVQEQRKFRMLTIKEVARFLSVNERTIYRLIKANQIPGIKIGGQWRFSERSIYAWIDGKLLPPLDGDVSSTE